MIILNSLIAVLIVLILATSAYRLLILYRIDQLEKDDRLSKDAQRKLGKIKYKEAARHVQILLINGSLIGATMLCMNISLLKVGQKIDTLRAQSEALREETYELKKEQKQLITKVPVRNYPEDGIGLTEYSWDELFENSKKSALQSEIESQLSQKIVPYFGLSNLILSLDVPSKTLSVSLISDTDYSVNQKTIKENIDAFVKEAERVDRLNQIHFQINEVSKKENETVYSATFDREDGEDGFERLSEKDDQSKEE